MLDEDSEMVVDPSDRYVFLLARYGDETVFGTSDDADVIDRMIPLYDDGTLHDVGAIVREKRDGGRYGLLASEALSDEHEVSPEAVEEASRRIGLPVVTFRLPDPSYPPQVAAFVPLDDPRMTSLGDVTDALNDLASTATPRSDRAVMPDGTTKAGVHRLLKGAFESASIEIIFHKLPLGTATDGGPMAAAWELFADLRGTDVRSAVLDVSGRENPEWFAALAGDGTQVFAPAPVTPERVRTSIDGLLVHAAEKGWSSSHLGKVWTLAAGMHGTSVLETAESLVGPDEARSVLESNECAFDEPSPVPCA